MYSPNKIIIAKEIHFPIKLVWKVITDDEHLKNWYFDFGASWKLEIQNTFEWSGGPPNGKQWLHQGVMQEIIHEKKLKYSWEYPGYSGTSMVTWDLTSLSENLTLLTLTHDFIIPFDQKEEALKQDNFSLGWNEIINNELPKYLLDLKNEI